MTLLYQPRKDELGHISRRYSQDRGGNYQPPSPSQYGVKPPPTPRRKSPLPFLIAAGVVLGLMAVGLAAFLVLGDGGGDDGQTDTALQDADTSDVELVSVATHTITPRNATTAPSPTATLTTAEVVDLARPAVVRVFATQNGSPFASQGSGFFVDSSGVVITNAHVVDLADTVVVYDMDNVPFQADVVGVSPCDDIAVLRVPAANGPYPVLSVSLIQPLVSEEVFAMGFPLNSATESTVASVHFGRVNRVNAVLDNFQSMIEHQAPLNPGNSGGPLLNMSGNVIGINTLVVGQQRTQGLLYAIDALYGQQVWQRLLNGQSYVGTLLARDNTIQAELRSNTQNDCYVLAGSAGDRFELSATAVEGYPDLDLELVIYGPDNLLVDHNDNAARDTPDPSITITTAADGDYLVVVRSHDYDTFGDYELTVR